MEAVGHNNDFPVKTIVKVLHDHKLYNSWKVVAQQLNLHEYVIEKLHLDLIIGKTHYADIFEDVLLFWQMQMKSEATLENFINVLGNLDDLKCVKDKLLPILISKESNPPQFDAIQWNQLDWNIKRLILSKDVRFLGTTRSLSNIAAYLSETDFTRILNKYLNHNSTLGNILHKTEYEIVKDSVPESILYYIPRTLWIQTELNPAMFQMKHEDDVFLFKDIDWSDMSQVTKGQGSDISSKQIQELTTTFIILENDEHMDKICQLTKKSVHYIQVRKDKYIWVKTRGKITTILNHINDNKEYIKEMDLINQRFENHNISTICIADSPGNGKSSLLTNLAKSVQLKYPERFTIFMCMAELIMLTKSTDGQIDNNKMKNVLAKHLSQTDEFGRQLLLLMFSCKKYMIELFVDGFDEIMPEDQSQALKLLSCILDFNNVRLCISTQQNWKSVLENSLGVLSFNIVPFKNPEKIGFLTEYWNRKYNAQMTNALEAYSKLCLSRLESNVKRIGEDIAGIPLQCRLLAETFAKEATEYSVREDALLIGMKTEPTSIIKLYKKLIKRWTRDMSAEEKTFYIHLALATVYPTCFPALNDQVIRSALDWSSANDMVDFSREAVMPKFIHKSFGEYVLADAVLATISNPTNNMEGPLSMSRIIAIFQTRQTAMCDTKFLNPALCIFLDSIIIDQNILLDDNRQAKILDILGHKNRQNKINFMRACAYHQTYGLFCLAFSMNQDPYLEKIITKKDLTNLLHTATKHAKLDLIKKCCQMIKRDETTDEFPLLLLEESEWKINLTPLHVAVQRGCFKSFEFFAKIYESHLSTMEGLLHLTVHNSQDLPANTIFEKIEIIKFLLNTGDKTLLDENIGKSQTPLLMQRIHVDLIKFLIEKGADVYAKTPNFYNFCHFAGSHMKADHFHDLLSYLVEKNLDSLIRFKNSNNQASFEIAVEQCQLHTKTVELLASILSDSADSDNVHRDSLLYHLVKNGYKAPALAAALKYYSSWRFPYHRDGTTLLHLAAYWENLDALEYFLKLNADPNALDSEWRTPLHVACEVKSGKDPGSKISKIVKLLIDKGADVDVLDKKRRKPSTNLFRLI